MKTFTSIWIGILVSGCSYLGSAQSNPQKPPLILIKNGRIVNADGQFKGDILIRGEKIIKIGRHLAKPKEKTEVIDASGMQIMPGGIDPHVHISGPFADDFTSGSKAALAGGITSIGDLGFPNINETLFDLIDRISARVRAESMVDVMIHPTIIDTKPETLSLLPRLAAEGFKSIKIFMASNNFTENLNGYERVLLQAKQAGILSMIHCEDQPIINSATNQLVAAGKESIQYYPESRPVIAEAKATRWAVDISEKLEVPIYIVHLSSKSALEICLEAQSKKQKVYVETRPIYLHLTAEKYQSADGPLYVGMPPLREKTDMEALWKGIADGSIHVLASDHAPWTRLVKMNASTIKNFRAGMSNLQEMLPVFYSEGVVKGKISLERFVALTSTNAAKLFGLYPQKGTLTTGADADLVIWDPKSEYTLKNEEGYSKTGFTIFDGWKLTGKPILTMRRGEIVFRHNKILANPGSGRILKSQERRLF